MRLFSWRKLHLAFCIGRTKVFARDLTAGVYCGRQLVHLSDQFLMRAPLKSDFEVVRRNKVYEEVAKQIERLILKKLKPGDKLPSERELAETLQVSRGSIRDAIRSLELLGLVEPRQGAGTIVRKTSVDSVKPFAAAWKQRQEMVSELLDFREIIEPPLAARAARNVNIDQITTMERILR